MPIYAVLVEYEMGLSNVAFAQGDRADIAKYYKEKEKVEEVILDEIKVEFISYDMAWEKENLAHRKAKLEKEIAEIEKKING